MVHSKEKILEALHIIKDECEASGRDCDNCPFYGYEECQLTYSPPSNWRINDENIEVWRGLL